jgi:hypothetical protein
LVETFTEGGPACITVTVRDTPPPVTVIVAVREEVDVLAWAVTVIVALLVLAHNDTDNQDALPLSIVQVELAEMVKVLCPPAYAKSSSVGETDRAVPACVTEMVRVIPPPLMVIVAVRWDTAVLAAAVMVIVALLEPVVVDSVSQEASPLLTVQLVLEVMVNVRGSPADEKFSDVVEMVRVAEPVCVTVMFRMILPPLMVIVAVR